MGSITAQELTDAESAKACIGRCAHQHRSTAAPLSNPADSIELVASYR
jgi:hypothetical protein